MTQLIEAVEQAGYEAEPAHPGAGAGGRSTASAAEAARVGYPAALALASAALIAGCGSSPAGHATAGPAPQAPPAGAPFLATSLVTPAGTWAVAVMCGPAASHNNFWQLFIRPAGNQHWKLVTPAGVPDNGGLVLAPAGSSLITGFRPSQYLTYTPLAATGDGGRAWSSTGPLDGAVADVPDAPAAAPGTSRLLALLAGGTVKVAAPGYTSWKTLTTRGTLAATPPGRRCGLRALTAVGYTPSGAPLLGGTCTRAGAAGIFATTGGAWQAAGPAIPAALARQHITALRLTTTANQIMALLRAGTGPAARLLAAWSTGNGRWVLSPALRLGGASVAAASFGPAGTAAVITTGGRAAMITSGSSWHALPALPPGTATLVPGPGTQADALAVQRGTLTVWRLRPGGTTWTRTQVIHVPIQYGSSG